MAQGITDNSLKFHLQNAKDHGVTQKEIAAIITHVAFYAGWPKAWAVFNLAKEVWEMAREICHTKMKRCDAHAKTSMVFPIGAAKRWRLHSILSGQKLSCTGIHISGWNFQCDI